MSVKTVMEWLDNVKSECGNEYSLASLPPGLYDIQMHRLAIKYCLVQKKKVVNKHGAQSRQRNEKGNYIWEITIGASKHRNIYNNRK